MAGGLTACAAALLGVLAAGPATAQGFGVLALESDAMFRGRSLSDGRPVMALAGSHDWRSGFSAGAEVLATATQSDGIRFLGVTAEASYARRLRGGTTVEGGIVHRAYSDAYTPGTSARFIEAYAGLSAGPFAARLAFSPDYFDRGAATLRAEAAFVQRLGTAARFSLTGGVLAVLEDAGAPPRIQSRWDMRAGIARDFGRLTIAGAIHALGPSPDRLSDGTERRVTATLGARFAF